MSDYQTQLELLQAKRRELRALEAQAERTARAMQPLSESDEMELMNSRVKADEAYRAAGRMGAPEAYSYERPDSYRLRLAEGLQKHSDTWKNANLSNALAAGAFNVAEEQIYNDARATGRTHGLKEKEIQEIPGASSAGHRVTEFKGGSQAWFGNTFRREPRRAVFQPVEAYAAMSRDATMRSIAHAYHRPTVQAPRANF
jgi:hypothetical protein